VKSESAAALRVVKKLVKILKRVGGGEEGGGEEEGDL
jgi:hypothetical protein